MATEVLTAARPRLGPTDVMPLELDWLTRFE